MALQLVDSLIGYIESNTNNVKNVQPCRKKRVLYIFPLKRDYSGIESLPQSFHNKYEFIFIDSKHFSYSSKAAMEFSMTEFIAQCIEKVKTDSIDIVISTRDMADLVHAVLATHFDHIKGPNYMSSFITLYKPYTKLFIDIDDPIHYEIIDTQQTKWKNIIKNSTSPETNTIIKRLLTKFNGKGFIKPPAASCSSLVGDFNDIKSFKDLLSMHSKHGKVFSHYLPEFVSKYIQSNPYKIINDNMKKQLFTADEISNILLAEEFMNTPIKITVDGCVVNKQIHIWGVVDSIYWSNIGKNECFIGCFMPSNLCASICDKLVSIYKTYVNRLIKQYGFDNQFIDIEFFVTPKNKIDIEKCIKSVSCWSELNVNDVVFKLMEINARCFMQMTPIYRQVFNGFDGDPISTLLKVYNSSNEDDMKFNAPELLPGICGLNGYLPTFASGVAEDLFDFDAAYKYIESGEIILAIQKGEMVNTVSQQGSLLAYANVTGKNYNQCFNRMLEIGKILIKKGAPWESK